MNLSLVEEGTKLAQQMRRRTGLVLDSKGHSPEYSHI